MNKYTTGLRVTSALIFMYALYNIGSILMNVGVLSDLAADPNNAGVIAAAVVLIVLCVLYLIMAALSWRCASQPSKGAAAVVLSGVFTAVLGIGVVTSVTGGTVTIQQFIVFVVFLANFLFVLSVRRGAVTRR